MSPFLEPSGAFGGSVVYTNQDRIGFVTEKQSRNLRTQPVHYA